MSKLNISNLEKMEWLNQPQKWEVKDQILSLITIPKSDFWQKTHYDFSLDTGSFYYTRHKGEFEVVVKISGDYNSQYDQMGIMIRLDEKTWMKTGIEYVDEEINISAVSTNNRSDWSMIKLDFNPKDLWIKAIRKLDAIEIYYSLNNKSYSMFRLAYFPKNVTCMVGLMAASPKGNGFKANFEAFKITNLGVF